MPIALREQIRRYNEHRRVAGEPEMTQARLADLLGVSQSAVSLWAAGKRSMTARTALKLASLLECQVEDLFFSSISQPVIGDRDRAA